MTITVLIPAHNEERQIAATLVSLRMQELMPDRVIVIADNCLDDTEGIARNFGARVLRTEGNTEKKAGALNQALDMILPTLRSDDYVLVMDADTELGHDFLSTAVRILRKDKRVGAVGGVFYGQDGGGFLGLMQRNEYTRYAREIDRTGRVMVLSGTAALFRPAAMRQVASARGFSLPGVSGRVYDTLALTEDNELTLALKTIGWRLESPLECSTVTEVMPTVGDLWRQRTRWYRGALENLRVYGFSYVTARYWFQQGMLGVGLLSLYLYLGLTAFAIARHGIGAFGFSPFWLGITALFVLERIVTVWKGGWTARAVASVLYIELAYDMLLQAAFVRSVWDALRRREAKWHHVTASPDPKGI